MEYLFVCLLLIKTINEHIDVTALVCHVVIVLSTRSVVFIVSILLQLFFEFLSSTSPM